MRNRDVFKEIINKIKDSTSIIIFPHIILDGDSIGSAAALQRALIKCGKQACIQIEEEIPEYLQFLTIDLDNKQQCKTPDLCIAVDCSDMERLGQRLNVFRSGKTTVNIDHHPTNSFFADLNYVDDTASATGEIIFDLIKELNIEFDIEIAEAIYSAISTDTGSFKYSNTTPRAHIITAELLDLGIRLNDINVELYQNMRLEKLRLESEVLSTLDIICNGKAASAYVTQEMLKKTGATMDETEGFIEILRNIQGVEVAIFFKEMNQNEIKVGLRSKKYADVSKIAMKFGGGGHVKAAGCTFSDDLNSAKKIIYEAVAAIL